MQPLVIILFAILPAFLLLVWIYRADKLQREPISQILKGFGYGVLSVLVAGTLEALLSYSKILPDETTIAGALGKAYIMAALIEEGVKLLFVWLLIRRNKYFDEHFDGIVYAASVGLGFAAMENIGYLFSNLEGWVSVAAARSVFATPGHFFFGVVMGYFLALAYFGKDSKVNFIRAFVVPFLLHGTYDFLLMVMNVEGMRLRYKSLILIFFYIFFIKMWIQGRKRIKMQLDLDRTTIAQHGSFTAFVENTLSEEKRAERGDLDSDVEVNANEAAVLTADNPKPVLQPIEYNEEDYMPKTDTNDYRVG